MQFSEPELDRVAHFCGGWGSTHSVPYLRYNQACIVSWGNPMHYKTKVNSCEESYMFLRPGIGHHNCSLNIFPAALLQSKGTWARCHNSSGIQDTSKNWRGFVDKHEARVAPGSGLLYSGDAYIGTDDLDTICWEPFSQMERKAKPVIAKPRKYLRQP